LILYIDFYINLRFWHYPQHFWPVHTRKVLLIAPSTKTLFAPLPPTFLTDPLGTGWDIDRTNSSHHDINLHPQIQIPENINPPVCHSKWTQPSQAKYRRASTKLRVRPLAIKTKHLDRLESPPIKYTPGPKEPQPHAIALTGLQSLFLALLGFINLVTMGLLIGILAMVVKISSAVGSSTP
jgi:hypothetical protein